MINIFYTIFLFNILIVLFKFFQKYNINTLQALIFNYLTAGLFSFLFFKKQINLEYVLSSGWINHAIIIGFLFIIVFNLFALSTHKIGISITTIANKMSVIIPVIAAIIIYDHTLTYLKVVAFILALTGIYFSSTNERKLSFDKKHLWLIILIFFGQGIADTIFNDFAQKFADESIYLFFLVLFLSASICGIVFHLKNLIYNEKKNKFCLKSMIWGVIFGIPNFFSLVFFLEALGTPNLNSSIVLAVVSMGVVVSSSLIGWIIFKEKLSKTNWIGISLCMSAIFIFYI